ncbi:MAG: sodium:proton antiporter NhaD [Planctomycetota bacterium]
MFASLSVDSLISHPLAIFAVAIFVAAYLAVVLEDVLHLRKSKPVLLAAGIIWVATALLVGNEHGLEKRSKEHIASFAEIFLFLLVAMTYINAINERNVFKAINAWLVSRGFGLRAVFWATGALSFCISPVADNMTTALVFGSVAVSVGRGNPRFIAPACVNIVVAANAGGAFSPFGDITTLMVWSEGKVATGQFFEILLPSIVNWLVPATIMSFFIPKDRPAPVEGDARLLPGYGVVLGLFLATIATAVLFHSQLHLPPALGMMLGLGYYCIYGYFEQRMGRQLENGHTVDVLRNVAEVEWDTMLFFFGVILCVGGLQEIGYLAAASHSFYGELGPMWANVVIGLVSAVIDNVPVMFAVLGMNPPMDVGDWLLVTLTAGTGGSLLSVGSAAGVALMGTARGHYTFARHLTWTPAIALGYAAAIACHELLQNSFFAHPALGAARPG